MRTDHTHSDRRRFLVLAGAATLSLSGCLGGDGDGGDDDGGGDGSEDGDGSDGGDGDPAGDGGTGTDENGTELTEAGARETVDDFLSAVSTGDVETYNAFLHSGGEIEPATREGFLAPDIEIRSREITRHEADEIVIEVAFDYELGGQSGERRWQIELRGEDGEWRLWQLTPVGGDEPAQSPEVTVQAFVEALDGGDIDAAVELLHEDATMEDLLREKIDEFEAVELTVESQTVIDRKPGWARIEVALSAGDGQTGEWILTLVVTDREWKIQSGDF